MTYTENYHLKKPDGDDFIDVADLNQNMDAIDAQLKAQAQKAEGDGTKVQEVQAALKHRQRRPGCPRRRGNAGQ